VAEDVITEAVPYERVVLQVSFVCRPIVGQLLRTQDQYGSIAQLVVLYDRQRGERLPQSDTVGKDAAVVGFQLIDNPSCCITLEAVELLPDRAFLIAGPLIWQNILVDVLEELAKDAEQHQEVNALWGVFFVDRSDMVPNEIRNVSELLGVLPNLIEQREKRSGRDRLVHFVDEI
jgi:hypothetical protein